MKAKTKRDLEKVLIKLVDSKVEEKRFTDREEAVEAIVSTTRKLFKNHRNRNT